MTIVFIRVHQKLETISVKIVTFQNFTQKKKYCNVCSLEEKMVKRITRFYATNIKGEYMDYERNIHLSGTMCCHKEIYFIIIIRDKVRYHSFRNFFHIQKKVVNFRNTARNVHNYLIPPFLYNINLCLLIQR